MAKQGNSRAAGAQNRPLPTDESDIFNQLQQEFDALVSDADENPATDSPNTIEQSLAPPSEFDADMEAELQALHASAPDTQPDTTVTAKPEAAQQMSSAQPAEQTKPAAPPISPAADTTATAQQPPAQPRHTASSAHPQPGHAAASEPGMSLATIALLGLATAILIAALAATYWSLTYPGKQPTGTTTATENHAMRVLVRNEQNNGKKFIPLRPANTTTSAPQPASTIAIAQRPVSSPPPHPTKQARKTAAPATIAPTSANNGKWVINLESFSSADEAKTYADKLTRRHLHSDIMAIAIKGKRWYRVRMPGFDTRASAEQRMHALEKQLKLHSAWISKSTR